MDTERKNWTLNSILSMKSKEVKLMKENKKIEFIGTKVSEERKKEIESYANSLGISVSAFINLAISDYMKKN